MNFRTSLSDTIPSVEYIFTNILKFNPFYYSQGKIPSNRNTAYALFFYAEQLNPDSSEQFILNHSIFRDEFIHTYSHIDLTNDVQYENPLLYYIIHRSEPFPTDSKYSQFLSNLFLKNHTSKTLPPQVRSLLCAIDFEKLVNRIDFLLTEAANYDSTTAVFIDSYIQDVTNTEVALANYYRSFPFDTTAARLAFLLLYALCDDLCLQEHIASISALSQAAATSDQHNKSYYQHHSDNFGKYRQAIRILRASIITLICLTCFQMVCLLMPFTYYTINFSDPLFTGFLLLILIISVALFSLRRIPFSLARRAAQYRLPLLVEDNFLIDDSRPAYQRFLNKTNHFTSRKNRNKILILIEGFLWGLFIIVAFALDSFPIFIAGAALSLIIFLECDHLLNRQYASLYDEHHPFSDTPAIAKGRIAAGEAKIYNWDYDKCTDSFRHHKPVNPPMCSVNCIRYIFFARIDRYQYQWTSYSVVLTLFNVSTIIVGILQFLLPVSSFIHIANPSWFLFFCIALLITTGIYYIIMLLRTEERFNHETDLEYYCSSAPFSDDFLIKTYIQLYNQGVLKNVDIGHGVYLYNCVRFEEGCSIHDISPDDRMIVIHRYYDSVRRVSLDFLFFSIAYFCIFVWHMGIIMALWCLPVLAVIYIVFTFILLPKWDEDLMKYKIKKYVP